MPAADPSLNTKEQSSPFDALPRLRDGETYFALIARDRLSPPLILQWADQNRRRALAEYDEDKITEEELDHELAKSFDAERKAWAMQAWKAGHTAQALKEAVSSRESYTGFELTEEQKAADRLQSAKIATSNSINETVAQINALRQLLPVDDPFGTQLDRWMMSLKELSDSIRPPRPGMR